jgi:7-cyano-7-deazaguanine synthase in queuosine biosynthesis
MSLNLKSLLNKYNVETSLAGRYFWQKDKQTEGLSYPLFVKSEYLDLIKLILGLHIIETDRLDRTIEELIIETAFPYNFFSISDQLQSLFFHLTGYRIRLRIVPCSAKVESTQLSKGASFKNAVLFSGGIDSLCGSVQFTEQHPTPLIHCQTNQVVYHKTLELSRMTPLHRSPLFCLNAMTKSTIGGHSNTRGLLFLSFAYSVAASLGIESVEFCENGAQMLDVMLGPLVYPNKPATKNTNPIYIDMIEKLLSSFGENSVRIERPFQEYTKAEMLARFRYQFMLPHTFSCFTTRGKSAMCGICYNCFMRRMTILAATQQPDKSTYEKHPFELIGQQEQTESYERNIRILICVLRHYAGILNEDSSSLNEVELSARHYFSDPINLATRFAKDIFLGVMKSLEVVREDKLNPLGKKAKELLAQVDKKLLIDRHEELLKLSHEYAKY